MTAAQRQMRLKVLAGMIQGLMDAMKPLLDEWSKLKAEHEKGN